MKATDFQINDIVFVKSKNKIGVVHEISRRDAHIWCGETYGSVYSDRYAYDDIEPVPLTPEILEKNGFEFVSDSTIAISSTKLLDIHTSIHFQFVNGKSCFVRLHHCGAGSYEFSKHVKSVHKLQHALRDCELDNLADNFKI